LLDDDFEQLFDALTTEQKRAISVFVSIAAEEPLFIPRLTHNRQYHLLNILSEFVEAFPYDSPRGT